MRSRVILGFITGMAVILSFVGCSKKGGKAVVLEKEHIAARFLIPREIERPSVPNVEAWFRVFIDRDPAWLPAGPGPGRVAFAGLPALPAW